MATGMRQRRTARRTAPRSAPKNSRRIGGVSTDAPLKVPAKIRKAHRAAVRARKNSYSPYSKYKVGAALVAKSKIITGCNIENANYGGTVCAERVALWKAISAGEQAPITDIVIVTQSETVCGPPCGFCLQVLVELCSLNTTVWLANTRKIVQRFTLHELVPHPFTSKELFAK